MSPFRAATSSRSPSSLWPASRDSIRIESLSRSFASICCKSSVRSLGTQPCIRHLRRTGITVRLLSPNSHDFLSSLGPRPSAFDRIRRIVVARRRGMAAGDQPVDQRFILGGEAIIERAQVIVPLFFGARAGDDSADERTVQYPRHRELAGGGIGRAPVWTP